MAKKKPDKATSAPDAAIMTKRKRADNSDHAFHAKKARISSQDKSSPKKTKGIKLETQECDICAESKTIYRNFPSLPTCSHDATVCAGCYEKHFVTRINDDRAKGWSACTCPLCGEQVEPKDAQSVLPRQVSKELINMIKNVERQIAQNWIWCSGSECGRGQLHMPGSGQKVTCNYCGFKTCYSHQIKWHEDLTCEEFDQAGDHDASMTKSLEEIQRTTKACPFCKTRIEKNRGCTHMNCTGCNRHWLWDTVPFDGEQVGTTAEIRGAPARGRPLEGDARQAVEQVIQFHNARAGNVGATNDRVALGELRPDGQPFVQGFLAAARGAIEDGLNFAFRPASPQQPPEPVLQPRPRDITHTPVRHVEPNQAPNGNGLFAGIFDGFAGQVRRYMFPPPLTSNIRATQVEAPPRLLRAAHAQTRSRASANPPVVVLDDSDGERRRATAVPARARARRGRPRRAVEVVDLTQDNVVIDLTGDD